MSNERALINSMRVHVKASLAGMIPAHELEQKVNLTIEGELCDRAIATLNGVKTLQYYKGAEHRANAVGLARAAMLTLMTHLDEEAAIVRTNLIASTSAADSNGGIDI